MKAAFAALMLGVVLMPAQALSQSSAGSPTSPGEIGIPSLRQLDRDATTEPSNEFSTDGEKADREMDRMNRAIDRRLIERGICTDC